LAATTTARAQHAVVVQVQHRLVAAGHALHVRAQEAAAGIAYLARQGQQVAAGVDPRLAGETDRRAEPRRKFLARLAPAHLQPGLARGLHLPAQALRLARVRVQVAGHAVEAAVGRTVGQVLDPVDRRRVAGRGQARAVLAVVALQQGEAVVQRGGQVRGGAQGLARAHASAVDHQHLPALAQQAGGGGQPCDAGAHHHHVLHGVRCLRLEPGGGGVADGRPDRDGACGGHAGLLCGGGLRTIRQPA